MLRQTVVRVLRTVLLCLYSALTTAETKVYFIHSDHLGTPQVVTDARQGVVWKAVYLPFGEAVSFFGLFNCIELFYSTIFRCGVPC